MAKKKRFYDGTFLHSSDRCTEVASDCSGADARAIGCGAISADPKRSGDSPVRVSDTLTYLAKYPDHKNIPARYAKLLLEEVRRLEQIVDSSRKET